MEATTEGAWTTALSRGRVGQLAATGAKGKGGDAFEAIDPPFEDELYAVDPVPPDDDETPA